ncbi:putative triacylglycerol lipase precursor [Apodospora peruviana]|uniref:Triacylglycerol lipase n=1 Tax=Apodospora peruviana TaxID=516989 RepID=A0AAE0IIC7_9PEZI|nr:putative triacylglycerol lipase precursor [Apodospora peruviana]
MKTSSLFFSGLLSGLAAIVLSSPTLQGRAVTTTELSQFKFFAQYAGASYCNSDNAPGQEVTCKADVCPAVTANKAVTVASFTASVTDQRGFIAVDHAAKLIVLSFRGSVSVRNWIVDFIFTQTPCNLVPGCLLHTGFYAAWLELAPSVFSGIRSAVHANPSYRVIATGHSLGGAVATIAAAYLRKQLGYNIDLYTYGSPRAGNGVFAKFVTAGQGKGAEFRVTHAEDPVARLPPIVFNYRHTSPEYWINSNDFSDTAAVKVCQGYANLDCNAGTGGFDMDNHGNYFGQINGCDSTNGTTPFRRAAGISDEEIETKLDEWLALDKEFVSSGEE